MCGIAGVWDFSSRSNSDDLRREAKWMADALTHRGPDGEGVVLDEINRLALSHRRLSIIDPSTHGDQPMVSSCGRFTITYNGELYNATELTALIVNKGRRFRGHSDTEVLLEGCAEFGIEKFLSQVNGIFAFALFDSDAQALWLCRDRIGVKPLYYGQFERRLLFASELKGLVRHPSFAKRVNINAVTAFLRNNYVPGDCSIYEGVEKVSPGMLLRFDSYQRRHTTKYWSFAEQVQKGISRPILEPNEAENQLADLLRDAVKRQMVSDVPIGGLLSGGIDSSLVVALMQSVSEQSVETFTVGFGQSEFDEAEYARDVAQHLGTSHHEIRFTSQDALAIVPELPGIYDEPFADSSQIPTCLLSKFVGRNVKVALTGDGGDELFAGYSRYRSFQKIAQMIDRLPKPVLQMCCWTTLFLPRWCWQAAGKWGLLGENSIGLAERGRTLARGLINNSQEIYPHLHCHWPDPSIVMACDVVVPEIRQETALRRLLISEISRWQYLDSLHYLPDDILVKVDRASMAASLELRVPLLDHRVVELAWRLPEAMKINHLGQKIILKRILEQYLPSKLFERPKMGFGVPLSDWMRGPLSSWIEDLINPASVKKYGILDSKMVWKIWQDHRSGRQDWGYWLWDLVSLQAWLEKSSTQENFNQ